MQECSIWFWKEPDCRWKQDVVDMVKAVHPTDKDILLLHCSEVEGFDDSIPLANFVLNLAESFNVLKKERTMFLNTKDLSQAIELCLERLESKTDDKKHNVTDEDVMNCHKEYVGHFNLEGDASTSVLRLKAFLEENNCADLWSIHDLLLRYENQNSIAEHLSRKKLLVLGTPQSDIFRDLIQMMAPTGIVSNVVVETPLDVSLQRSPSSNTSPSSVEVTTEPLDVAEILADTEYDARLGSATQEYVEEVVTSFFGLLVNSRNELTLAKVMISPFVDLGHGAFTELKHLAERKEMPMCQTVLSYVTRLKLGGKGYAPAPNCPLLPHLKSLELFVDTLNQMQTLVEEDPTPTSAVKRLVNVLKKKLLKSGSDRLRESAIEAASENLKAIVAKVFPIFKSESRKSSSPQVFQENLDFVHYFVNYVNCSCLTFDPKRIMLQKQEKRTPLSLPPLLGYFRSPEEESSCDSKSVFEEESVSNNLPKRLLEILAGFKPLDNEIQSGLHFNALQPPVSYFHYSDSSSVSLSCVDSLTPSKMSFKGCLSAKGDEDEIPAEPEVFKVPKKSNPKKAARKRTILGEITNENQPLKNSNKPQKRLKMAEDEAKGVSKKVEKIAAKAVEKAANKNVNKKDPKPKSKVSKKLKLIEGQGKITSFFSTK